MIFDTGSSWLWIDSINCDNCPDVPKFDEETSDSLEFTNNMNSRRLSYGSGSLTGYEVKDSICIT